VVFATTSGNGRLLPQHHSITIVRNPSHTTNSIEARGTVGDGIATDLIPFTTKGVQSHARTLSSRFSYPMGIVLVG